MNAIDITNLSKNFKGKQGHRIQAVQDLTLAIAPGEIFGFLGPNGAGKSTTIKMLMGLIAATSGSASIMGTEISSHVSRKHVGYLPENPSFYDYLSGEEYLSFIARTFGIANTAFPEKMKNFLELLNLWEARKRPIRGYSKGMVQRLGLAQALIHDPDVYILDEPMSGLDPIGRALVKDIILDLKKKGKCVFFSTHITSDVETVCDRVGIIVHGTLQRVESVNTILTEGIVGYRVQVKVIGTDSQREYEVPNNDLSRFLASMQNSGNVITFIEPKRKNLEEFFLDIVKG